MGKEGSWFDRALAAMLPIVPKPIVKKVAARYVAGETLDQAMQRVAKIAERGACCTLDVLGEEITDIAEGEKARDEYIEVLDRIHADGADSNVSVKLTAFGLKLDVEQTYKRVKSVVEHARSLGNFVRIDMEDSTVTTVTLEIYRRLREEGFDNVGAVLQAYLHRSLDDVVQHADLKPSYRLCKGIYVEPERIAYKGYEEINENFLAVLDRMFEEGSYVGIATHDKPVVEGAEEIIKRRGLSPDQYEFQMLLGVEDKLGTRLLEAGHKLRIYVPFGERWYAYCMRRLHENPKIGRYVLLSFFKRS